MNGLRGVAAGAAAVGLLVLAPLPAGAEEEDGGIAADGLSYIDFDIAITENGDVEVTETFGRHFGSGLDPTYEASIAGSGEIDVFGWRDFGLTDVDGEGPGEVEVRDSGDDATVVFTSQDPEGYSGVEEFTLSYTYERFLVPSDDGEPRYYADLVSADWDIPVGETRVGVTAPSALSTDDAHCYAGRVGTSGECDSWSVVGGTLTGGHGALEGGEGLTVELLFEEGSMRVDAAADDEGPNESAAPATDRSSGVQVAIVVWVIIVMVIVVIVAVVRGGREGGGRTTYGHANPGWVHSGGGLGGGLGGSFGGGGGFGGGGSVGGGGGGGGR